MKNLNAYQHSIVLNILWLTDLLNGSKFNISIPFVVTRSCWPLEGQQIRFSYESFANVMTELSSIRLIQDGQRNPPGKWPLQDVIIIPLHHVNKQGNMFSDSAVHTIQVDPHTQLIAIQTCVEGRAVDSSHHTIDCILPTLPVIFNPPDVRPVTHTAFILQQFSFIAVKPEKQIQLLIIGIQRIHLICSILQRSLGDISSIS